MIKSYIFLVFSLIATASYAHVGTHDTSMSSVLWHFIINHGYFIILSVCTVAVYQRFISKK